MNEATIPDPADEYESLAERAAKEFPFDFYAAASPETRATIESDPQAFQQRVRDYAYGIAMNAIADAIRDGKNNPSSKESG